MILLRRFFIFPLLVFIRTYQYAISPFLGPCCRFSPTCSEFMVEALTRYGLIKGLYLGGKRILRCHPCSPGGYDPVP